MLLKAKIKTGLSRLNRYPVHWLLQCLPPRPFKMVPETPESICLLSQEKLGDALLLMPLLKALNAHFPDTELTVLASGKNRNLLNVLPWADHVLTYRPFTFRFLKTLLKNRFDIFYNTKDHPSRTFLLFTLIIRAAFKTGHAHPLLNRFYHQSLTTTEPFMAAKNAALLQLWHLPMPEYKIDFTALCADQKFLTIGRPRDSKQRVGINLSAGEAIREWDTNKIIELIQQWQQQSVEFILMGMPDKRPLIETIAGRHANVMLLPQTESVWDAALLVAQLDCLITPDTSTLHLAVLQNIPVIGLFQNRKDNLNRFFQQDKTQKAVCSPGLTVDKISVNNVSKALQNMGIRYD